MRFDRDPAYEAQAKRIGEINREYEEAMKSPTQKVKATGWQKRDPWYYVREVGAGGIARAVGQISRKDPDARYSEWSADARCPKTGKTAHKGDCQTMVEALLFVDTHLATFQCELPR